MNVNVSAPRHPPTLVIVPGLGNSGPDHWQTHLENAHAGSVRVEQKHWDFPVRGAWTRALDRTLAEIAGPVALAVHSLGVLTVAEWARRFPPRANVVGALLVAPPDTEGSLPAGIPPAWLLRLLGWSPIPRERLPWPSTLVASTSDRLCTLPRAEAFARAWGSAFVNLGAAGHINTAAGYGVWPEAERLIAAFAGAPSARTRLAVTQE